MIPRFTRCKRAPETRNRNAHQKRAPKTRTRNARQKRSVETRARNVQRTPLDAAGYQTNYRRLPDDTPLYPVLSRRYPALTRC
jgi:hypothetical protein